MDTYDFIIIGGGPGGYSSAIYAARFNMKTLILTKVRGGLVTTTHLLENWPGEKSIAGYDLMMKIEGHVKNLDVDIKDTTVKEVKKEDVFTIKTSKDEFKAKSILLATGTEHRKLPAKGAKELEGKGVSYCATCDGMFYKDKVIAMVGGGDSAVKEGLLLSDIASKVFIIARGDKLIAEPINLTKMDEKVKEGKVVVLYNTEVSEILGDRSVEKIILTKEYDGSKELKLSGVFGAIGQIPQTDIAKQLGVELNEKGEIKINRHSETNVPGVLAAGDVTDGGFKQAITASAEGVKASHAAYNYISRL